ncbi:unnamed protein product, partial [Symbiodinium necroappetens]
MPRTGVVDAGLERIGNLATGKDFHNAARNLHNYLHSTGKTFPVCISSTRLTIRRPNRGGGEFSTNYPLIYLSSWMRSILELGGEFLLGGWNTEQPEAYTAMFARFWERYEAVNPEHPLFFAKTWEQRRHCIPVAVHGDEGRGLGKHPVLVESYQPLLPWSGEDKLNMVGHSYTTRLLACILPSQCYAKHDKSVDGLHKAISKDLTTLFERGITVVNQQAKTFYAAVVGAKGYATSVRETLPRLIDRMVERRTDKPVANMDKPNPSMEKPEMIQPDLMHCYNLGFGKDLAASGVIVVTEAGFFGADNISQQLDEAFAGFMSWCAQHGHTSTIKEFDLKKTFKMTS